MYKTAQCYEKGEGTERNEEEAIKYYKMAAENGHKDAQKIMFEKEKESLKTAEELFSWYREHFETDKPKGFRFLHLAANKDHPVACYALARHYLNGIGVIQSREKAFILFQKSSDLGNAEGMGGVALCYRQGWGVKKDLVKSFEHWKKAADAGDDSGMYMTAQNYEKGEGIDSNEKEAVRYYKMAAEKGHFDAKKMIEDHPERFITSKDLYMSYLKIKDTDLPQAIKLLILAADKHHPEACHDLAERYNGYGIIYSGVFASPGKAMFFIIKNRLI